MKKLFFIFSVCFCICSFNLVAESNLNENFARFGIKSIGIYTESYEDLRSDNFLIEIGVMNSDPLLADPYFYRHYYCNFDLVTPPLTSPGYPLDGSASGLIDDSLSSALGTSLRELGWQTKKLSAVEGLTVSDLLDEAESDNVDAVLVVRYTPIKHFVPVESYRNSSWTGSSGILTGKLQLGLGYIPALELYDAKTGVRLWYSAYNAAQHGGSSDNDFVANAAAAGHFFAEFDISGDDETALWTASELINDFDVIWKEYNVDERAADLMVTNALTDVEHPFPAASDSTARDHNLKSSSLGYVLWTDHPSYKLHGTKWGIGYSFDYIGKFNLYYRDDSYGSSDNDPSEVIETAGAMMHTAAIPFYSIDFKNLSFEPEFLVGYIQPYSSTITYDSLANDPPWSDEVYVESTETETAVISAWSVGFDLRIKYYIRFSDNVSAYIGAQADARTYFNSVESDAERPIQDRGSLRGHGEGLYFFDGPDLTINAAAIAGVRFERQNPFEIFAMYHPVGQAGDLSSPTISAGIRYLPSTWGWTDPHAQNVAGFEPKE